MGVSYPRIPIEAVVESPEGDTATAFLLASTNQVVESYIGSGSDKLSEGVVTYVCARAFAWPDLALCCPWRWRCRVEGRHRLIYCNADSRCKAWQHSDNR